MEVCTARDAVSAAYVLTAKQKRYLRVSRWVSAAMAFAGLLVLAVPMGVIALILKANTPDEPVIFRQMRVGRNSEQFELMKFRSMRSSTPRYVAAGALEDKDRYTTKFGRFLRITSLDELPQLVHVLSGKMSLIGPRPLIPQEEEVHALRRSYGVYQLRPGLTGWAQVNGRDLVGDREKAELDRYYLEHVGFALDWKIFWMSIAKVLSREGVQPRREKKPVSQVKGQE